VKDCPAFDELLSKINASPAALLLLLKTIHQREEITSKNQARREFLHPPTNS